MNSTLARSCQTLSVESVSALYLSVWIFNREPIRKNSFMTSSMPTAYSFASFPSSRIIIKILNDANLDAVRAGTPSFRKWRIFSLITLRSLLLSTLRNNNFKGLIPDEKSLTVSVTSSRYSSLRTSHLVACLSKCCVSKAWLV